MPEFLDYALADEDRRYEKWIRSLPRCHNCDEHITDDYLYDIDGEVYCWECVIDLFRKRTESYVNE